MSKEMSFEEKYKKLQTIVEKFEKGSVPLAESLILFKNAMEIIKNLETELKTTEQTLEEIEKDFTQNENTIG